MSTAAKLPSIDYYVPTQASRFPELLSLHKPERAKHVVQFYEDESYVIENVAFLAAKTLETGDSAVLVATESRLEQFRQRLAALDINLAAFRSSGLFVAVDASEALSQIMVSGWPDHAKFNQTIGRILCVAQNKSANGFVFAFGEMVALLRAANNPFAAIRLEQFWNTLAEQHRFSLYCAYSLKSLGDEPSADALIQICAEHALTIPRETSL
jgi:hypothetical protein